MNKEKAELYASLYARVFLVTETAENLMFEGKRNRQKNKEWEQLFEFTAHLLDSVQEQAEKDLTAEELEYFNIETDHPNRYGYE